MTKEIKKEIGQDKWIVYEDGKKIEEIVRERDLFGDDKLITYNNRGEKVSETIREEPNILRTYDTNSDKTSVTIRMTDWSGDSIDEIYSDGKKIGEMDCDEGYFDFDKSEEREDDDEKPSYDYLGSFDEPEEREDNDEESSNQYSSSSISYSSSNGFELIILLFFIFSFTLFCFNFIQGSSDSYKQTEKLSLITAVATPSTSSYENSKLKLNGNTIVLTLNFDHAFQIEYTATPEYISDRKFVFYNQDTTRGHTISRKYISPYSTALIRVIDPTTNEIIKEEGFGSVYSVDLNKKFRVYKTGNFRIEISGNHITLNIRIS